MGPIQKRKAQGPISLVCGFSNGARPVFVLDHMLDAAFELSNHEDYEVDEQNLPDDWNVQERDESQKEGENEVSSEQMPDIDWERSW